MDKIILKGCRFYAYHGVFSEEKTLGQIFMVDLELSLDLKAASKTDKLEQFLPVTAIKICITKENPPIAGHYDRVGIELKRERS